MAPAALPGGTDEGARLRYERDRFLAFAFCASDILMELDERHNVVFAAGAVSAFLGVTSESVAKQPLMNFITAQSRPAIGELLLAIHDGRRLEPMKVRLNSATGPTPPMLAVGYRLSDLSNRIFITFRMARSLDDDDPTNPHRRRGGLHDEESFAEMAARRLRSSAEHPNEQLTLIELDTDPDFSQRLDQAAETELKETIATCLRAKSVDGRSAGELEDGRYGVVHQRGMDVGELNARIEEATRAADPGGAGVTVRVAPGSSPHNARSSRMPSANTRYRCLKSPPNARYSGLRYPTPKPGSTRPSLITSTSATCSASSIGACNGSNATAVPMRRRDVRAATAAANVKHWGRYPSSKKWCSVSHTASAPSRSASSMRSNHRP